MGCHPLQSTAPPVGTEGSLLRGPLCGCCHCYCRVTEEGRGWVARELGRRRHKKKGKTLGFGSWFVRIGDPFPAPEAGQDGFPSRCALCTEARFWVSGCELVQAGVLAGGRWQTHHHFSGASDSLVLHLPAALYCSGTSGRCSVHSARVL